MKKVLVALAASVALSAVAAWPEKSVNIVVPFPPGGSTDTIARAMAQHMGEKLGQRVLLGTVVALVGEVRFGGHE